jgi:NAD-dependent dihydropyrimidine dehydrogenase PreA subunit
MGLFVEFEIDQSKFPDLAAKERCAWSCPVDIYTVESGELKLVPENEDECILCDLCVQNSPDGAVKYARTYQEWMSKG